MPEDESTFTPHATRILEAHFRSCPLPDVTTSYDSDQITRYVSGALSREVASNLEVGALVDAGLRRTIAEHVLQLNRLQRIPFADLFDTSISSKFDQAILRSWTDIVQSNIHSICTQLVESIPNSWPELARIAKIGPAEKLVAKTIRKALFTPRTASTRGLLQFGYGYRLGSRGGSESPPVASQVSGQVSVDGRIKLTASFPLLQDERTAYFALSLNDCFLPLASAKVSEGFAQVQVADVAPFMKLSAGPIAAETIAVQLGDWPKDSKVGAIIVESNGGPRPVFEAVNIKNGNLEVTCYFEAPQLDGVWELLLAVSPNNWQNMARFEVTSLVERPQILLAKLPGNFREGPFGGALCFRRVDLQKV